LPAQAVQKAFYKGDQEYFKPIFTDLWSRICQTDMYPQYANELEIIHDMITVGKRWNEKDDFRKAWEIVGISKGTYSPRNMHSPTSRNVHSRNNSVASRSYGYSNRRNRIASSPVISVGNKNRHVNPLRNTTSLRSSYTIDFIH
jgi:hypothetical protein